MSYGQNPYGQNPYGQQPYGQQPPQHQPSAQPPTGQPPAGQTWGRPPQPGAGQPGGWNQPQQGWGQPQGQPWGAPGQPGQFGAPPAQPVPATPVPEPEPRKAVFRERDLPVVTTETIPGRVITEVVGEVIGVVTRARDMRPTADLSAVLTGTRQDAVDALVTMATEAGADGVVGLRFDGGKVNDGTSEVAAYGTAVKLETVPEEPNPFTTGVQPLEGSDPTPADVEPEPIP